MASSGGRPLVGETLRRGIGRLPGPGVALGPTRPALGAAFGLPAAAVGDLTAALGAIGAEPVLVVVAAHRGVLDGRVPADHPTTNVTPT
jgi:hypothetical protein